MEANQDQSNYELPPELTLMIMRVMDKPTLEKSTLVCRNWLALSQPFLFESIAYGSHPADINEQQQQQSPPLEDLLGFFSASPHVCTYVSKLTLKLRESDAFSSDPRARSTLQTLAMTLQCLPRLRVLEVDKFPLECRLTGAEMQLGGDVPAVACLPMLKIGGWYRAPTEDCPSGVARFLTLFEEIEHLVLGTSVEFHSDNVSSLLPPPSFPRVRSLTLESTNTLQSLASSMPVTGLESLQLPVLTRERIGVCRKVLDDVRATLRHLELQVHIASIGWPPAETDYSYLRELDLGAFPLLDTFTVVLPVFGVSEARPVAAHTARDGLYGGVRFYEPAYSFVTSLFSVLPPHIRTFRLKLHYFSLDPYYSPFLREWWDWRAYPMQEGWEKMYNVLVGRVRQGLRHIEFGDALGQGIPEAERQAIAKAMPLLWEEGAACFV
ncbi:uncharacterized protein PHACADRAFT_192358 [Phanerochaete carnosa HHB-10118-sp]|uniref:F-box domain-containing protein n=1 Tax=Phanerochaete carnosa (strain HHB-10118-sp) TaxID=650164 RepID=K5WKM9_PHACS|nr:uncharacterized protein PHACADRAFT_192358 [Phanerochaete carnosa HHB-10118-sp]EKM59965.1 hypothetical protein PHACADRAFT_192358 [Phanerochaete carnosa HHB-10118-sp]